MHLDLTAEQHSLRKQLRTYYRDLFTPELRAALNAEWDDMGGSVFRQVVARMGADGWLGIGWPKEYGGQGRGPLEQLIFWEETYRARAPLPIIAVNTIGPTVIRYGTDEQKRALLPGILRGELHFGVGYTEPGAGTDLASLDHARRARRRRLGHQRPEDLHDPRPRRRLHLARRAHRSRRAEAQGHLDHPGADLVARLLGDADPHARRRAHQRDLLRRRARARSRTRSAR